MDFKESVGQRDQYQNRTNGETYEVMTILSGRSSNWENPLKLKVSKGKTIKYYDISSLLHYTQPTDFDGKMLFYDNSQIKNINPKSPGSETLTVLINDKVLTSGLPFNEFVKQSLDSYSLKYVPKVVSITWLNENTILVTSFSGIYSLDLNTNTFSLLVNSEFNPNKELISFYEIEYLSDGDVNVKGDEYVKVRQMNFKSVENITDKNNYQSCIITPTKNYKEIPIK
jgi:hypothetical protein